MATGKPSTVNLGLLAVTVLSLLLAAYGMFFAPRGEARVNTTRVAACDPDSEDARHSFNEGTRGTQPERTHASNGSGSKPATGTTGAENTTSNKPEQRPAPASSGSSSTGDVSTADSSGQISGIVLDSAGNPVEFAHVVARPADSREQPAPQPDFERELAEYERFIQRLRAQQRSTDTGPDGRFTLKGLNAAMAFDLSASAPAGGSARLNRVACGDDVTLLLSLECILRGKVSHADGKPLTRFTVNWLRADMPGEIRNENISSQDGRYEARVRPGRHSVWVSIGGVEDSPRQELDIPQAGAEANFVFSGLGTLSGTVKDAQQNPLPDVTVRLTSLDAEAAPDEYDREGGQRTGAGARTDSLGRYRFEALSPGRYTARVSLAERSDTREITLVAGENTQDFSLNAGARVTLRFRRTGGDPVSEVNVAFERKGRTARPTALPAEEPGVRVYIGLEPGDYSIRYFARGGAWARHEAKIIDGDNQITLDIADAAFLQGKVSGAGTPENLMLRLRPESGKAENNTHYSAMVAADGGYRLGPALPGNYVLELLAQRRIVVFTASVKLGVGDTTQDVAVRDLASVALRVTLPDGKPASGARVSLTCGKNSFTARCDERGLARIGYVPAGECALWAEAGSFRSTVFTPSLRSGESDFALELKAPNCVRVSKVDKGGEAEKAGVLANDLVFQYNGRDVPDRKTLDALIKESRGTESVTLSVDRGGRVLVLNMKGGVFGGSYADAVR
jgi:hypothetical protein